MQPTHKGPSLSGHLEPTDEVVPATLSTDGNPEFCVWLAFPIQWLRCQKFLVIPYPFPQPHWGCLELWCWEYLGYQGCPHGLVASSETMAYFFLLCFPQHSPTEDRKLSWCLMENGGHLNHKLFYMQILVMLGHTIIGIGRVLLVENFQLSAIFKIIWTEYPAQGSKSPPLVNTRAQNLSPPPDLGLF